MHARLDLDAFFQIGEVDLVGDRISRNGFAIGVDGFRCYEFGA